MKNRLYKYSFQLNYQEEMIYFSCFSKIQFPSVASDFPTPVLLSVLFGQDTDRSINPNIHVFQTCSVDVPASLSFCKEADD